MLQSEIEQLFDCPPAQYTEGHRHTFEAFKGALNRGEVRAAEPDAAAKTGWRVNGWVKKGILLGFRMGSIVDMSADRSSGESAGGTVTGAAQQHFIDKSTYPLRAIGV